MATFGETRRWNPQMLDAIENLLKSSSDRLVGFSDELRGALAPVFWIGDAADAAEGRRKRLSDAMEHLVAEVNAARGGFMNAADGVLALQQQMAEADGLAVAHRFSIGDDGAIVDHGAGPDVPHDQLAAVQGERQKIKADLLDRVGQIMRRAHEIDTALADLLAKVEHGQIQDGGATTLAGAASAGMAQVQTTQDGHYKIGPPEKPNITFDEDFLFDTKEATAGDYMTLAEWRAKVTTARILGHLPDGTMMYEHYLGRSGDPMEFDYRKAYDEDSAIRAGVDTEIARAAAGAEELIEAGRTDFSMTGQPSVPKTYPTTENWQKAVGDYHAWSHSNVRVEGNTVTMEITVEAEDRYNFNRGQGDIATGTPDEENGRLTEVGLARPFDVHGTMTKTVTWELGNPPTAAPPPADGADPEPRR